MSKKTICDRCGVEITEYEPVHFVVDDKEASRYWSDKDYKQKGLSLFYGDDLCWHCWKRLSFLIRMYICKQHLNEVEAVIELDEHHKDL